MTNAVIVRAWKDAAFRATLAPGAVPAHPAGPSTVSLFKADSGSMTITASPSPRYTDSLLPPCL
jgi:mersacidin/lichenicidin family type 2 lantibiotic